MKKLSLLFVPLLAGFGFGHEPDRWIGVFETVQTIETKAP
jgi:hypothetical protein